MEGILKEEEEKDRVAKGGGGWRMQASVEDFLKIRPCGRVIFGRFYFDGDTVICIQCFRMKNL